MGVFKKQSTRPVPNGATITTTRGKETARWRGRGRTAKWITAKVFTLADGRKVIRQESSTYFCRYRDHAGVVHVVSTRCKDESNAQAVLANLERRQERIRAGILSPEEDAAGRHQQIPLSDHFEDYSRTLRGTHGTTTRSYLERLATALHWSRLADLRRSDLEGWLADQVKAGRGARSRNAYLTACTSFGNWCVKNGRLTANPFDKMPHANLATDPRRPRRAMTQLELSRLLVAARATPGRPRMTRLREDGQSVSRPADVASGGDRAELYQWLSATGVRVGETKQLRVVDLDLEGGVPIVRLSGSVTKNGKAAELPLRSDLVDLLRARIARLDLKDSDPLFQVPAGLIKRFYGDLARAGIPKYDNRGRQLDIHSLRVTFGTSLALAGVHPRVAQQLLRHSDVNLTMRVYTDPRIHDLASAVESIGAPKILEVAGEILAG